MSTQAIARRITIVTEFLIVFGLVMLAVLI